MTSLALNRTLEWKRKNPRGALLPESRAVVPGSWRTRAGRNTTGLGQTAATYRPLWRGDGNSLHLQRAPRTTAWGGLHRPQRVTSLITKLNYFLSNAQRSKDNTLSSFQSQLSLFPLWFQADKFVFTMWRPSESSAGKSWTGGEGSPTGWIKEAQNHRRGGWSGGQNRWCICIWMLFKLSPYHEHSRALNCTTETMRCKRATLWNTAERKMHQRKAAAVFLPVGKEAGKPDVCVSVHVCGEMWVPFSWSSRKRLASILHLLCISMFTSSISKCLFMLCGKHLCVCKWCHSALSPHSRGGSAVADVLVPPAQLSTAFTADLTAGAASAAVLSCSGSVHPLDQIWPYVWDSMGFYFENQNGRDALETMFSVLQLASVLPVR